MGWSSGTEVFDAVCSELIKEPLDKKKLLVKLIKVMYDKDWDGEEDSSYLDNPLVREAFLEVNPTMFKD